jgi:hypothetical protein
MPMMTKAEKDLAWARTALEDAITRPEERDLFWSSMSVIPRTMTIMSDFLE